MKTILIYGDSNTFGCNPLASDNLEEAFRFGEEERWTELLARDLGEEYKVIDEGLPGRTAFLPEVTKEFRTGNSSLYAILQSHYPIDVLVFMLGTNDIKFAKTEYQVGKAMEALIQMSLNPFAWERQDIPEILLIAPPHLNDNMNNSCFYGMFDEESVEISKRIGKLYEEIANHYHCMFLDASEYVKTSPIDSVHLDKEEHKKLAEIIAVKIRECT